MPDSDLQASSDASETAMHDDTTIAGHPATASATDATASTADAIM